MLDQLKFVRGAVAKKDLIPVLTHFCFNGGQVQGGNGKLTICHTVDMKMDVAVEADRFLRAVDACEGEPKLKITDGGKLTVSKGKFRALLPTREVSEFPWAEPDKGKKQPAAAFVQDLCLLRDFVAEDASRPWACGVLSSDGHVYATNNIIIVRKQTVKTPTVNIPGFAIDELMRIKELPDSFIVGENSITFFYPDGWLKTQLFHVDWPDVGAFFKEEATTPVPEGLPDAVARIKPFCTNPKFPVIQFDDGCIRTQEGDTSATVEGFDIGKGSFRVEQLEKVLAVATHLDVNKWPEPCPFRNSYLEGLLVGVR